MDCYDECMIARKPSFVLTPVATLSVCWPCSPKLLYIQTILPASENCEACFTS